MRAVLGIIVMTAVLTVSSQAQQTDTSVTRPATNSAGPPTFELSCWQNGALVIYERDITTVRTTDSGVSIHKVDGTWLRLFIGRNGTDGLCLMKEMRA